MSLLPTNAATEPIMAPILRALAQAGACAMAETGSVLPGEKFATEKIAAMTPGPSSTSTPAPAPPSFEGLVDAYQDKVFRLAWSMLGNETAAQDVAQEVFLKIWKALPSYRGTGSASSWIYTITRNTCLTELKKARHRGHASLAEEAVEAEVNRVAASGPASGLPGREMDVQTLLEQLPEHYRRVLALFYLEQKSYEEVAAMLAIPMGTVKTYLHRAKKELARLCANEKEGYAEL